MSKVITSPVEEFPGTVTLYDPMTLPMVLAFNRGSKAAGEAEDALEKISLHLPGILGCVEKWDIEGVPPDRQNVANFPFTPLAPAIRLMSWLISEVNKVMFATAEVPND
jgi:hypothetical protein